MENDIYKLVFEKILAGEPFGLANLQEGRNVSFIGFMKQEIEWARLKVSTRKNHRSTFALLQLCRAELCMGDLTYSFLCDFERFLHSRRYHRNTISKHMRHVKRYINLAIKKDLFDISHNPFRKYRIQHVASARVHLTPEELENLESLKDLEAGRRKNLQKSLDMFLFSCYTGLRFSDIASIRKENFIHIDNKLWLVFSSMKTNTPTRIPLYLLFKGKAVRIYEKYEAAPGFFHIEVHANSNINKHLSVLSRLANIEKRITFHSGRHTHATLLLYNGVPITTVQKLLGHKSVKTTEIYSNIMDMTLIRDLEKIF